MNFLVLHDQTPPETKHVQSLPETKHEKTKSSYFLRPANNYELFGFT